jgi:AAA-like domain
VVSDWAPWSRVDTAAVAGYATSETGRLIATRVSRFDLGADSKGRRTLVRSLYETLLARRVRYAPSQYHPSDAVQRIRTPQEVLDLPGEGTCLDLALVFCGLCLANDLLPMLIVTDGHAFAAVSMTHGLREWDRGRPGDDLFRSGPLGDATPLRELLDEGSFLPVECTGFALSERLSVADERHPETVGRDGGVLTFERAVLAGREQLGSPDRPFAFAVDIATAQNAWGISVRRFDHVVTSPASRRRDAPDGFAEEGDVIDSRSPYWIDRPAIEHLRRCVRTPGQWAHILAARDVGKSSTLYAAMGAAAHPVVIDFHGITSLLPDLTSVCRHVIDETLHSLGLDVPYSWDGRGQPMANFRQVFASLILPAVAGSLVLALDHIEALVATPDYATFLSGLRACHNRRLLPGQEAWTKFGLVLVGRSEPFGVAPDADLSPVTVGEEVTVGDFSAAEVAELNRRHGAPVPAHDLPAFVALTGGHPRLVQVACNELRRRPGLTLDDLAAHLVSQRTPVGRTLAHGMTEIRGSGLTASLRAVLEGRGSVDDAGVRRLALMGWVTTTGRTASIRCGLFERYFRENL